MGCSKEAPPEDVAAVPSTQVFPGERHLANIRQLTYGGDNAEAYWAFGKKSLVYQTTQPEAGHPFLRPNLCHAP